MTRMIAKAYRMADAIRAVGVPVVMAALTLPKKPTKPSAAAAGPAMPTPLLSAKPTKPGRNR